ncbi:MAG: hypothetical protein BAJALOKI1v1_1180010 [Promethearchaeota archaeon]|nr:MAG: hypothetical protein BAJALOKI1v1_1180010 [Candidatus Lokiarchaeota archaeon]
MIDFELVYTEKRMKDREELFQFYEVIIFRDLETYQLPCITL